MATFFRSECGKYICRSIGNGNFEVWTSGGERHWRHDNRIRTWKQAAEPRHPMEYAVGGFTGQKIGQKSGSFTLHLLHCDIGKIVEAWRGNTVIESISVVFRRKIPPQNVPYWLRKDCQQ